MPKDRIKVAVAQISSAPGFVEANVAHHLGAIAEARRDGADLLLFPELSLTGYLGAPDVDRLALDRDAAQIRRIAEAAGPMAVSLGFIERGPGGRAFNSQILLCPDRVDVHRKINLPGYGNLREDRYFAAGDSLDPVVIGGGWRVATTICADAWNPALPWIAALRGADILLVPSASARGAVGEDFDNPRGWGINLAHTALTYAIPVLFANHCVQNAEGDFWGGSRILDADANVLCDAGPEPRTIFATLDFAHGAAARARLPTVRDSRPDLVRTLLAQRTDA